MFISLLSFALFSCFLRANGATTQTVQVGLEGSFFDPSYVVAQVGDIISFVFSGNIHTVTQSTFENPCLPLEGGFNSGPAGKGTNGSAPVPVWNLQITNTSEPIWYFCQGIVPSSHCAAGMVGVINPPNVTVISQFQAAARAVSGTPSPTLAVTLTGIGAFATASPSDLSTTLPSSSSAAPSSSTSSALATFTSVAPPASSGSNSNIGAIVGGAVGGTLGLLLILVFLFWVLQQRKSRRRSLTPPREDFSYTPKRPTNNLDFVPARNTGPDVSIPSQPSMGQAFAHGSPHPLHAPTPIRPQIARPPRPIIESEPSRSTTYSQPYTHSGAQPNVNVESLAREVVAVLRQAPAMAGPAVQNQYSQSGTSSNGEGESSGSRPEDGRKGGFQVHNRDNSEHEHAYGGMHPHPHPHPTLPPHYNIVMSPPGERTLPLPKR